MHDIGNAINRVDHAHSGAILAYEILKNMGMDIKDRTEIMTAIGNHDESTRYICKWYFGCINSCR